MATVVLIPKPGRPPGVVNLRPISLTSCVGKVAEHVIHNRISRHIEGKNLFPYMIGLRASLSTQDAMKLLMHHFFNNNTIDVRAILGLDLEKAFDNITHAHIVDFIPELGLGETFHKFVSSFLRSRKATHKIGDLKSDPVYLGPNGTPQGAVISRSYSALPCASYLNCSPKLKASTTLSTPTTSQSGVSAVAREGRNCTSEVLDQTEHFLTNTGRLKCSSSKSELLMYRPVRRGPKPKG
ncbi:hypothetical protein HPB47_015257 [Ixodes persulcatus]|uniref:Uncharacterized protein n=1 Tax=Ixodes persulcatus TaxID=34615 RepID=A0AC60QU39_IXOPE|nr:hypothetical protein HPB47_015257 [Ixodes persulcatus]